VLTSCASPVVFRAVLSIVDFEGDGGFGVRVEADPDAEPSQAIGKPRPRHNMAPPKRARTSSMSCGRGDWRWRQRLSMCRRPRFTTRSFKVTQLTSFLADGELRLGLTHQRVEDCDQALEVEDETERGLKALEPGFRAPCERVRKDLAVGGD
jgi:hypothetical protein